MSTSFSRTEVLSGMSGPTQMTAGLNHLMDGINKSILYGLFGRKPTEKNGEKSSPSVDSEHFAPEITKAYKNYPAVNIDRFK